MSPRSQRIKELYRQRSQSWFVRLSMLACLILLCVAAYQLSRQWYDVVSIRRWENVKRFAHESYPYALRSEPFHLRRFVGWVSNRLDENGCDAILATFSISIVAISLAGSSAFWFVFLASRNVATASPFLPSRSTSRIRQFAWKSVVSIVRAIFVLSRAVPEYIWAFLLIAILGPNAWPAILALAIHNFGILGKLGAEVVENTDPAVPSALRAKGLSRMQISAVALVPMSLPKWMLFFFYRWETCIREATVLGMLGISSIGFWVRESRARDKYDEMLFFILLGAVLVLVVDLISAVTRWMIRRS